MKQNPKEVSLFDIEKGIDNLNNYYSTYYLK